MVKYLIKRVLQGILVLFAMSILIFILSRTIQGDPARVALGANASEEAVESMREHLHLDEPSMVSGSETLCMVTLDTRQKPADL